MLRTDECFTKHLSFNTSQPFQIKQSCFDWADQSFQIQSETLILINDENGEIKSLKAALFYLFLPQIYNAWMKMSSV